MKAVLCFAILVAVALGQEEDDEPTTYTTNNSLNLPANTSFYPTYGEKLDLFTSDGEIRNLVVPPSDYLNVYNYFHPDATNHPLIYFNLYKDGQNDGLYLLNNKEATKIYDARDSVADYPDPELLYQFVKVYLATSDGIYTYDSSKNTTVKFGNITEDIKAIDKVSQQDEIYILTADNKIYNVTEKGTVKTKVEGIEYAKDFVIDLLGAIYFIGEDNKPQVLYKGSATPVKITGLNFDVTKVILGRPMWDPFASHEHTVPLIVDGVSYVLLNSSVFVVPCDATVPDITGFSSEYSFVNVYGVNGHIYLQSMLGDHASVSQKRGKAKSKKFRTVAFHRYVEADYKAFKELKKEQKSEKRRPNKGLKKKKYY